MKPPSDPENAAMRRGKLVHALIEAGIKAGALPLAQYPKAREEAMMAEHGFEWQKNRASGARLAEHVIGLDPFTGDARPYEHKDHVPQNHMPIIVDLVILGDLDICDEVEVWDWKTGSPFSSFSYEPQAFANALGVGLLFGADKVTTGLAYLSPEGVKPKSWTRDVFDFAADKAKLRMWAEKAPTAEPVENDKCRYCPVGKAGMCPAKAKAA
ncbi:MAG: PD-(D/E)XK nuclease family protein [Gemmatimonadota bacterium]